MTADVYFADIRARSSSESRIAKLRRLFDAAGFPALVRPGDLTAVKLHFGERGCDTFVKPVFVRQIVDRLKEQGAKPFLTDTGTLYAGSRSNALDHIVTAVEHGFDYAVAGAPVIIADGLRGGHFTEVNVGKQHFASVRIAGDIAAADSMIVLSHVKGHDLAGFGGAIKNLAMGCAPPVGKAEQHAGRPLLDEAACTGCGKCTEVCPWAAMTMTGERARFNPEHCVGCGDCMRSCPAGAIEFDWTTEIRPFLERMVEYAFGATVGKERRIGYVNLLMDITPDCDCVPWSDAAVVPDIGILASTDPVAIDHASYDLVNSQTGFRQSLLKQHHAPGGDKFQGTWSYTDGRYQIAYAAEIDLGESDYRLIEI
ncbi:DUF362 domain-containing protein [Methanoculleus sp. FWC-SCC1]|uniref:DUF362 domain-containing protein n=1 Tax=Methanoculleus frigidifontis TaxID=2584085 RepID=A0ABT8M9V8_9EURY|nr:DUF362 domain-containing protein [Methanoculleus sp. FWC-SCC1]MDN7024729.1 DUF362 domain-containing protein [Methanoculleus sp. FWC-SCC1]